MTPAEIKFALEQRLFALASDGGPVPTIVGIHSVVLINATTVSGIFDIVPDTGGSGLHFEFELPTVLTREELCGFSEWLASSGYGGTLH